MEARLNLKRQDTLEKMRGYIKIESPTCYILTYYLWDEKQVATFSASMGLQVFLYMVKRKIEEEHYVFD